MDVIRLLPDSVANQIAAGEVIQRPASVVKELLENSIDAGAKHVQLIIKEAGKKLIQVIDDGKGMTEVDARMSFERHATSKIDKAEDLFSLRTKGFRGEALASIAAIAHIELKTCTANQAVGTHITIKGSRLEKQEATAHPVGTTFSVKNLFFNVPARRKFLKSDNAENRHVIEEFQRVALAHPDISFVMHRDEREMFNLPAGSFRQRIVAMMGSAYDQRLVPIEETTDVIGVQGFVCKPEFAKKTRGEQYMFMNDRFIKHPYLHHAVLKAYDNLLVNRAHPSYFLRLQVDPARVDVNIHPTKTEVKFEEERGIYMILSSAVRQSLGKYNIAPSLDFESESSFTVPPLERNKAIRIPQIQVDENYNPFDRGSVASNTAVFPKREAVRGDWKELYDVGRTLHEVKPALEQEQSLDEGVARKKLLHLFQGRYIITHLKSGLVFIDPKRAHERILYEDFVQRIAHSNGPSQQLLFPETLELNPAEMDLTLSHMDTLRAMGFDIEEFGKQTVKINGIPAMLGEGEAGQLMQRWLADQMEAEPKASNTTELVARTMARQMRTSAHSNMDEQEMQDLIDRLFGTEQPYHTPGGLPIVVNVSVEEIDKKFEKRR